jgi:acetyl-CoA carboxylase alpha subunit
MDGIVDFLIKEPVGGAQNDPAAVISEVGRVIRQYLKELVDADMDRLMEIRSATIERLTPRK